MGKDLRRRHGIYWFLNPKTIPMTDDKITLRALFEKGLRRHIPA